MAARLAVLCLSLSLLTSACVPYIDGAGPAVRMPALAEGAVVTADGFRLPLRSWMPEGEPGAVVVALHGFNDYSFAFESPAAYWATRGIATYAYDQRGFGATANRGLWPGTETLVADAGLVTALIRRRHPDTPIYLLGESMGGAVAMVTMAGADPPEVAGLILVAPAVRGRAVLYPWEKAALWVLAHTVPWLRLTGEGLEIRPSDNLEMLRALARDPLVIKATRIDAVDGLVDLMDAALDAAPDLTGRMLVQYGAHDELIPRGAMARLVERLPDGAGDRRRIAIYRQGFHMLLRDLNAEPVMRDVAAWIENPEAPLPSGADRRAQAYFAG